MRKHINSMMLNELKNLPFFCWECITIKTDQRDIDLVIRNPKDMEYLLKFLIISIKTLDGKRGTGKEFILRCNQPKKT